MRNPSHSADSRRDRQVPGQPVRSTEREEGLTAALQRVVRRVLRTHRQRTGFEGKVLDTAQRLLERHHCFMARDVLERLVVDELFESLRGNQSDSSSPVYGVPCPYTRVVVRDSTMAV